ncbi:MAG: hypothetical protein P8Z31_07450, partial [Gammaproteobacteria bacterium]
MRFRRASDIVGRLEQLQRLVARDEVDGRRGLLQMLVKLVGRQQGWKDQPEEEDLLSTLRMIKALYVISADVIRIHFKGVADAAKCKNEIRQFARDTLLGAEIIDERIDEITLQILIKHSEFPIEKAVRRMAIVALSANREAMEALK